MTPVQSGEVDPLQLGLDSSLSPLAPQSLPVHQPEQSGDAPVDTGSLLGSEEAPVRRAPMGTLILAGVVLVAGGALYGMRLMGVSPRQSVASDTSRLRLPEIPRSKVDHTVLLADLSAARTSRQVPTAQVKKNPFQLIGMALIPSNPGDAGDSLAELKAERARLEKARAERQKAVDDEVARLQLHAVIGGAQPVARINGLLYRIGDKVGKFAVLKNVNSQRRSVELEIEGRSVWLSMDKQNPAP